jgi:hypothetical protein
MGCCESNIEKEPSYYGHQEGPSVHEEVRVNVKASKVYEDMTPIHSSKLVAETDKPEELAVQYEFLLPEALLEDVGKKCLILDLDETLVHSSFSVYQKNFLLFLLIASAKPRFCYTCRS